MNFSNENVLIIAALIGIIIMFLTSSCLCKNNTEQFIDTNKNNAAQLYEDIKKKSSDSNIIYNAIISISNAMDQAKTSGKNNVEIMNAFNASNAITNSTNNITPPNLINTIKTLTDPINKALTYSLPPLPPGTKLPPNFYENFATSKVNNITTAINDVKINAYNAKIMDDALVLLLLKQQ